MFHFPAFASNPLCIQGLDIFIVANSNRMAAWPVRFPCRARFRLPTDHCSLKMGSPIRKSTDQSLFAAPHGLSQRTTSFIASQRQGIHQMPLRHLIALITHAHPLQYLCKTRQTREFVDTERYLKHAP